MSSLINSNLQLVSLVPLALTFSIFISTAAGWYFGRFRIKRHGNHSIVVRDFLVTAIFGLSALVLGLTFSGSTSRYISRMDMNRVQAQTLQEIYGSLKYLSPADQVEIKNSLNQLLELRLTTYKNINNISDLEIGSKKLIDSTRKIQEQVTEAVSRTSPNNKLLAQEVLVPQVRSLSSSFFTGIINAKSHPPELLMRFLFTLVCIGSFLIGYTMVVKNEIDWLLATLYTVLVGFSLYVILAMEAPNLLMPYEVMNQDFLLLQETMKGSQ